MVLLWSTEIILMCCGIKQSCYILISFIILEDFLTIIFCSLTKRFKKGVTIAFLCITVACFAITLYTIYVGRMVSSDCATHYIVVLQIQNQSIICTDPD
uniref:Uncharacterized protein n=1 Tax=Trichobilharzia regenti TaxID=157069 RepID=A0AA85JNG0_TRIRE|nr:unnamed protein product [Trichobilharzia regenti]